MAHIYQQKNLLKAKARNYLALAVSCAPRMAINLTVEIRYGGM